MGQHQSADVADSPHGPADNSDPAVDGEGAAVGAPSSAAGPPAMFDGRYLAEGLLGEGTAGIVYLCRHIVIDKLVAIKVLRQDLAQDELAYDRFVNEARAASAIGSEHIVETLDFGHTEEGSTYIVMEYLEGETLGELLTRERFLEFPRIIGLIRQVVGGLAAAHAAGIVHRDIKPDNLFVSHRPPNSTPEGNAASAPVEFLKILDFGIAKMASAQGAVTRAGAVFGTPHYMSPEQAAGDSADARADIYSVGIILHELACGRVPFDAEAPLGILTHHLQTQPPRLSDSLPPGRELPAGYEEIVLKCLSKKPEERYCSATELDSELANLQSGLAPQAVSEIRERDRIASMYPSEVNLARRNATALYVLATAVLVVGLGFLYLNSGKAPPQAAEARLARPPVPVLPPLPAETASAPAGVKVDLVLFPLEAHVYQGDVDLGAMPVSVLVPEGETVTVLVKHKGYISRRLDLDGSKSRVVVGLRYWKDSRWGKAKLEAEEREKGSHDPATPPRQVPSWPQ